MELGEFDIEFIPRTAVKAQALADFVAEFTGAPGSAPERSETTVDAPAENDPIGSGPSALRWKLFVDRSSGWGGSGQG